jgi:hypothetical protein
MAGPIRRATVVKDVSRERHMIVAREIQARSSALRRRTVAQRLRPCNGAAGTTRGFCGVERRGALASVLQLRQGDGSTRAQKPETPTERSDNPADRRGDS